MGKITIRLLSGKVSIDNFVGDIDVDYNSDKGTLILTSENKQLITPLHNLAFLLIESDKQLEAFGEVD